MQTHLKAAVGGYVPLARPWHRRYARALLICLPAPIAEPRR
jgi:hypothetical protein